MRKHAAALLLLASLPSAFSGPSAVAAGGAVVAGPAASLTGYATPGAVAGGSVGLDFVNADPTDWHNLVSVEVGPDSNPWCGPAGYPSGGCPLFWSPELHAAGQSAPVQGLGGLATGVYTFLCEHHPGSMIGVLVVP